MKSYVTEGQIRLVGKAWEIRRYLKIMLDAAGQNTTLSSYTSGMPTPQQRKPQENTPHPRVIPFPLK